MDKRELTSRLSKWDKGCDGTDTMTNEIRHDVASLVDNEADGTYVKGQEGDSDGKGGAGSIRAVRRRHNSSWKRQTSAAGSMPAASGRRGPPTNPGTPRSQADLANGDYLNGTCEGIVDPGASDV